MLWEPKRREKEDRRPAPLMWMQSKVEEKGKVKHVTIVDCQGTSQGNALNLREEGKEAKEARVEKEVTKGKVRAEAKEEEKDTKGVSGIVVKRVTSQQNVGM